MSPRPPGDDTAALIGCRIDRYVADLDYRQFIDDTQRLVRIHMDAKPAR